MSITLNNWIPEPQLPDVPTFAARDLIFMFQSDIYVSHLSCWVFDSSFRCCLLSIKEHAETKWGGNSPHYSPSSGYSREAGCTNEQILLGGVTSEVWCVDWVLSECGFNSRVCVTHCRSSRTPPLGGPSSHWGSSREGRSAGNVFSRGGTACSGRRPPNSYSRQISAGPQREKYCNIKVMQTKPARFHWETTNGLTWQVSSNNFAPESRKLCFLAEYLKYKQKKNLDPWIAQITTECWQSKPKGNVFFLSSRITIWSKVIRIIVWYRNMRTSIPTSPCEGKSPVRQPGAK